MPDSFEERLQGLGAAWLAKLGMADDTSLPTSADLGELLGEAWMEEAIDEFAEGTAAAMMACMMLHAASVCEIVSGWPPEQRVVWMSLQARVAMDPEVIPETYPRPAEALRAFHDLWEMAREAEPDLKHPLAPLIKRYLERYRHTQEQPSDANVLTAGKAQLARIPHSSNTAALATWEDMPDAVVVEVDGEPVSSQLHLTPKRACKRKEDRNPLPLPGTSQASDLRLALIRVIEAQPDIDRRNPLPADTLYLLALGSALTRPVSLHADQLGAMMANRLDAHGVEPRTRRLWRSRAWAAIGWASMSIQTPRGHWMPILAIDYGRDLPEGFVRIWPYNWGEHGKGYRLTGVLTQQGVRRSRSGSVERLTAGIEDIVAASGRRGRDRRPWLLVPERKGGPGPVSRLIPYPEILARSGFHFDLADRKSNSATRELWRRLSQELSDRGYLLSSLSRQAAAGDVFEVVEFVKGGFERFGGIRVRASDRWIEAQEAVSRKKGDSGLDAIRLPRLFD